MIFKNPPECDKPGECRFEGGAAFTTLVYTPPQYDRSGNLISSPLDNKITSSWRCAKCGKSWTEVL